jgi:predicted DNA-binding transcriptional regulator AlpA
MSKETSKKTTLPEPRLPESLTLERVLDAKQGAELFGVSVATFRRLHRTKKLPAPVQISDRRLGWKARELLAYRDARKTI